MTSGPVASWGSGAEEGVGSPLPFQIVHVPYAAVPLALGLLVRHPMLRWVVISVGVVHLVWNADHVFRLLDLPITGRGYSDYY